MVSERLALLYVTLSVEDRWLAHKQATKQTLAGPVIKHLALNTMEAQHALASVVVLVAGDPWDTFRRTLSGRFYVPHFITDAAADLIFKLLQVCHCVGLSFARRV